MPRVLLLQLGNLTLDLNDHASTGLIISDIDLGYATVREVKTDLPGQDGEYDETAYFSSRGVTITGAAFPGPWGSRQTVLDRMAPFLAPGVNAQLIYAFDDDVDPRSLTIHHAPQWSSPISAGRSSPVSYQWTCPDPIAYGLSTHEVTIQSVEPGIGRTYPRTYPRIYPASTVSNGQGFVDVDGNYPSWPVFRLYGACLSPSIYWLDQATGEELGTQIVTSGITVDDGHFLEIDMKARTVLLDGDPTANRYSGVDFGNTSWGPLLPGLNLLRFQCASSSSDARAQVVYRPAYLQ